MKYYSTPKVKRIDIQTYLEVFSHFLKPLSGELHGISLARKAQKVQVARLVVVCYQPIGERKRRVADTLRPAGGESALALHVVRKVTNETALKLEWQQRYATSY